MYAVKYYNHNFSSQICELLTHSDYNETNVRIKWLTKSLKYLKIHNFIYRVITYSTVYIHFVQKTIPFCYCNNFCLL